jgi:hypothetical protein
LHDLIDQLGARRIKEQRLRPRRHIAMTGIQEDRPNRIPNRSAARLARRDDLAALFF